MSRQKEAESKVAEVVKEADQTEDQEEVQDEAASEEASNVQDVLEVSVSGAALGAGETVIDASQSETKSLSEAEVEKAAVDETTSASLSTNQKGQRTEFKAAEIASEKEEGTLASLEDPNASLCLFPEEEEDPDLRSDARTSRGLSNACEEVSEDSPQITVIAPVTAQSGVQGEEAREEVEARTTAVQLEDCSEETGRSRMAGEERFPELDCLGQPTPAKRRKLSEADNEEASQEETTDNEANVSLSAESLHLELEMSFSQESRKEFDSSAEAGGAPLDETFTGEDGDVPLLSSQEQSVSSSQGSNKENVPSRVCSPDLDDTASCVEVPSDDDDVTSVESGGAGSPGFERGLDDTAEELDTSHNDTVIERETADVNELTPGQEGVLEVGSERETAGANELTANQGGEHEDGSPGKHCDDRNGKEVFAKAEVRDHRPDSPSSDIEVIEIAESSEESSDGPGYSDDDEVVICGVQAGNGQSGSQLIKEEEEDSDLAEDRIQGGRDCIGKGGRHPRISGRPQREPLSVSGGRRRSGFAERCQDEPRPVQRV